MSATAVDPATVRGSPRFQSVESAREGIDLVGEQVRVAVQGGRLTALVARDASELGIGGADLCSASEP
jgi:hypothetical protein